jgi:soluble lytic murein transglycosylase-like protein
MTLAAACAAATIGLAGPTVLAAEPSLPVSPDGGGDLALLGGGTDGLERAIDIADARDAYERALAEARKADVAPQQSLIADDSATVSAAKFEREARELRERAEKAEEEAVASPESYGVSQSTLDAIASCESGGDPTAVSADGTYRGKYQFDTGTWASVGGSGDPAAAPEEEQDMRAAILYSRAGSSPWPVCG